MPVQPGSPEERAFQRVRLLHRSPRTLSLTTAFRYIKELADRIRGIESKLQAEGGVTHDDMESLFLPEQRRTGATDDVSRKRPYSSISGGDVATPSPARQSPWNAEQRPLQPAAPYSEHDLAPAPLPISINGLHDKVAEAAPMEESMDIDEQPELDEHSLLRYVVESPSSRSI